MGLRIFYCLFFTSFISCSTLTNNDDNITVYNFEELFGTFDLSDNTTYVVNFWATWCSPCIKELPYFEYVNQSFSNDNVKVILVSLDFPSQVENKLKPFIAKNNIKSSVVILDDSDINSWVPRVSSQWDGGIPATLILNKKNYNFYPKPFEKKELISEIKKIIF